MTDHPAKPRLSDADIRTLNQGIVEDEFYTPDRLYLDWGLFRDPYLGAAISLLMTAPDQAASAAKFKLLTQGLAAYQQRDCSDIEHYFPKLGLTRVMLQERLADPAYQEQIFFAAPFTSFIQTLKAHLNINANHSAVREKYTKVVIRPGVYRKDFDPVCLVINTYPLRLEKRQHDLIGAFFTHNYAVDVEIIAVDPKVMDINILLKVDEIYTHQLSELLDNEAFSKALTDLKFVKKNLFGARYLGTQYPVGLKPQAPETERARLKVTLDVMTQFCWIPNDMLAYNLYPPPTAERGAS